MSSAICFNSDQSKILSGNGLTWSVKIAFFSSFIYIRLNLDTYDKQEDHDGSPPSGAGPVLTPGASNEQTWKRSTTRCYLQNIKALGLPLSKKNSKICLLFPMFQLVNPRAGQVLTQGHHMNK